MRSPKQLGEILFDDLKLEPTKKTATKKYSTNAEVLNSLIGEHPIIEPILEYRQLTKLNSTYIEGIEKLYLKIINYIRYFLKSKQQQEDYLV